MEEKTPRTLLTTVASFWRPIYQSAHAALRRLRLFWNHTVTIAYRADNDHIFMLAAGIAFNIIIALIPTVLMLLFVLGIVLRQSEDRIVQQLNDYANLIIVAPGYRNDIIESLRAQIHALVENRGITGAISIIGLLWTASALATSIRVAVNKILRCREVRSYFIYKLYDIAAVALIGLLVFISILAGPVLQILTAVSDQIATLLNLTGLDGFVSEVVNVAITLFLFWIIFRYMPYQQLERHIILIGTLASTALWEMARIVFGFYISEFTTFSRVYGAYAFFAAAAFWLYYSALVFLVGAEIAYHVKQSRWNARRLFNKISTTPDEV